MFLIKFGFTYNKFLIGCKVHPECEYLPYAQDVIQIHLKKMALLLLFDSN